MEAHSMKPGGQQTTLSLRLHLVIPVSAYVGVWVLVCGVLTWVNFALQRTATSYPWLFL
jgi:hypothetical protein